MLWHQVVERTGEAANKWLFACTRFRPNRGEGVLACGGFNNRGSQSLAPNSILPSDSKQSPPAMCFVDVNAVLCLSIYVNGMFTYLVGIPIITSSSDLA